MTQDVFVNFRKEIDAIVWSWVVPGASATTDFFGKRQDVTVSEVLHGAMSQTGIMVKLQEYPTQGWFDAAWLRPKK